MPIFSQRPTNDRRLSAAITSHKRCFGRYQFLANSIEFHFTGKTNPSTHRRHGQKINIPLTLELSQSRKSASTFSSSEPVAARSDCCRLETPCVGARPSVRHTQAVPEHGPKVLAIGSTVKTFDCLLYFPSGVIARLQAGARTLTQTWILPPDHWQRVVKV